MSPKTAQGRSLPCGRPAPVHAESPRSHSEKAAWQKKLEEHLDAQNLKHSGQRLKIVEQILAQARHFSAQEIVRNVQEKYPTIGAATVYRNIKLLCDAAILKETLIDDGRQVVYELYNDEHHDHIVCLDCGEIFEFHDEGIEKMQDEVSSRLSFKPAQHRHVIYAHCAYGKKKR